LSLFHHFLLLFGPSTFLEKATFLTGMQMLATAASRHGQCGMAVPAACVHSFILQKATGSLGSGATAQRFAFGSTPFTGIHVQWAGLMSNCGQIVKVVGIVAVGMIGKGTSTANLLKAGNINLIE
jgi:hypothetical protein